MMIDHLIIPIIWVIGVSFNLSVILIIILESRFVRIIDINNKKEHQQRKDRQKKKREKERYTNHNQCEDGVNFQEF